MHSLSGDIYRQVREYFCSGQTSQMPRNVAKSSGIPLKVRQGSRFPLSDVCSGDTPLLQLCCQGMQSHRVAKERENQQQPYPISYCKCRDMKILSFKN